MELVYLNYKEPLKEIEDGHGYWGTIAQSKDGSEIQCHICGKMFSNLGSHVFHAHEMKAEEYKDRFKLAKMTPLCSDEFSKIAKERTLEWMSKMTPEALAQMHVKTNGAHDKRVIQPRTMTLEELNRKGICPDQLLDKIREASVSLGKTPTVTEFNTFHKTQRFIVPVTRTFGSWKQACEYAGLTPNKTGGKGGAQTVYTKEQLLQFLKDYQERTGLPPTANDCARGFIPSLATYIKHFGSIKKAREAAGLDSFVSTRWKE
jgi:hypothetical protein